MTQRGRSGLGLGHLGREIPPDTTPPVVPRPRKSPRSRDKGKRAEREVRLLWHANGWPNAFRTPRSGGLRVEGTDFPPFPLDLCSGWPERYTGDKRPSYGPWIVEVKRTERDLGITGRGYTGEAFVRSVLTKQVVPTTANVNRASIGQGIVHPVLFARVSRSPWKVYVPVHIARFAWEMSPAPAEEIHAWVELVGGHRQFFDEIAGTVL